MPIWIAVIVCTYYNFLFTIASIFNSLIWATIFTIVFIKIVAVHLPEHIHYNAVWYHFISTARRDLGDAMLDSRPAMEPNLKPMIYSLNDEQSSHEETPCSTSQQQRPLKIDHLNPEDLLIIKSSFECKSIIFKAQIHDLLFWFEPKKGCNANPVFPTEYFGKVV